MNVALRTVELCAGAGAASLAIKRVFRGARTVLYVEREAYAAAVLAARMETKDLDAAPVWSDLTTLDAAQWRGAVDLVVAGFPCQPHSLAGKRLGTEDERWIWPAIVRIIRDMGPRLVVLENVRGLLSSGGLDQVLADLASLGFDAEWDVYSAAEAGAPHRRDRVFILAHAYGAKLWLESRGRIGENGKSAAIATDDGRSVARSDGWGLESERSGRVPDGDAERGDDAHGCGGSQSDMGYPDGTGLERRHVRECERSDQRLIWPPGPQEYARWRDWDGPQPAICRNAHGLAHRVDRLRLCGNGIVPQQLELALRGLLGRIG